MSWFSSLRRVIKAVFSPIKTYRRSRALGEAHRRFEDLKKRGRFSEAVSYAELISNFTFSLEDEDGNRIMNGTLSELIILPPNATIRLIDSPELGRLGENDMFYIKEGGEIVEGCNLILYYNLLRDPVGEVELIKS